ncbi:sigma-54-dependent transcriptional regulator [Neptunomonas japonica]|uniref:Two-component system, NtrC family, C4-dicarboxylate transport response regulator DctD n=1 Tax=Neptunomonas japonica JAMM 1380 TaxID=1441457 RepID=A0A7R6SW88_9GAMM|nr:sigma-54 dependent transcriptional regulator [Neptunomonas japonica]BBB30235.1 two-component system, NtrC family, C4-dicarboxylate transport response regulator DctD [Neptunomonas japonica JAMM 1380]
MDIRGHVILVDDEAMVRQSTEQWLKVCGFSVDSFACAESAMQAIDENFSGVVVTDVKMPGMDGLELLREALLKVSGMPVILLTAHGDVDMAISAMRKGAYDFIEKPYVPERLAETVQRACEKRRLVLENHKLQQNLVSMSGVDARIIGVSPAIQRLKRELVKLAEQDTHVIVYGETGTGKELVAQCLHEYSHRKKHNFVPINCGAIPESLIESELFGHEAGAFTSAAKRRVGKFEYSDKGTLFLDEIESMPANLQIKLLRAFQEGVIERLGSNTAIEVDLRVIAASKVDLRDDDNFREDLFYRLSISQLHIPPLRERLEDVPLLFNHYLKIVASDHDKNPRTLSVHDHSTLMSYQWPGNVRELKNIAIRFSLDADLSVADILMASEGMSHTSKIHSKELSLAIQVANFEADVIRDALSFHQGNIKLTMEQLDLPRRTLNQKMIRYGINRNDFKC